MSVRSCHRRFEVEAVRDGRITGRARTSIEQHVSTCPVCKDEARELQEVDDALVALPVAECDATSGRRQRQRLLASFNEQQLAPPRVRIGHRQLAGAFVVVALAVLAVVVARRGQLASPSPRPEEGANDVVVVAPESAHWSRQEEGATTHVRLDDGEMEIHVKHHGDGHGLLVALPDGELEDIGTMFHVEVRNGRTMVIAVREGAVVFRRTGAGAVMLGAGQTWVAGVESAASASPAVTSPEPAVAPMPNSSPRKAPPVASTQASSGGTAKEFRDAVALLNAGDAAGAADALRTYLARRPSGVQAEDASYLLVLALHRRGDEVGAAAAARDYLRLYPHGLRRPEVERFASTATASP